MKRTSYDANLQRRENAKIEAANFIQPMQDKVGLTMTQLKTKIEWTKHLVGLHQYLRNARGPVSKINKRSLAPAIRV